MLRTEQVLTFALLALPTAALAQRTFVVDHMLQPGSHFRDIPQAVAEKAPQRTPC